jgi:hypothetical protein
VSQLLSVPASKKPALVPVLLFGGLSVISAVLTAWFMVETNLLERRQPPITFYTRNFLSWHPWFAGVGSYLLGAASAAAVVHFVADQRR